MRARVHTHTQSHAHTCAHAWFPQDKERSFLKVAFARAQELEVARIDLLQQVFLAEMQAVLVYIVYVCNLYIWAPCDEFLHQPLLLLLPRACGDVACGWMDATAAAGPADIDAHPVVSAVGSLFNSPCTD